MIVSASYRSDIPAFYGEWFVKRLAAGFCRVANPYGGQPYRVALAGPALDGFVFWTRNAQPFRPALEHLAEAGIPFVLQYSLTGYPRPLEASVVGADAAIEAMRALAARFGRRALVWRYDPVLLTSLTPPAWHRETFARLAGALTAGPAPACDEVVLSFAQIYAKTRGNLDKAAQRDSFTWQDPPAAEKRALLTELAGIAAEHGLSASLCSQPELLGPQEQGYGEGPLLPARCIDAVRLSDVAQRPIAARSKGNRPGCLCAESRDIGAYDSCPHGCVYCYAVRSPALAKRRYRAHDPDSEFLIAPKAR